ncbi:hypothetical protein MOF32_27525 [Priestia megaterium]|uniref:hypothetical protein n=1 Tax=Priestia megaterium TaxID=1404 RepID=UPI00227FF496|nr:hypothetical protein [Priestia megaterium]MCY9026632.1 hypothetical protein [Priestia megaterium]
MNKKSQTILFFHYGFWFYFSYGLLYRYQQEPMDNGGLCIASIQKNMARGL